MTAMPAPDRDQSDRELAELLAANLGCDRGAWTLELVLQDGRLRHYYRHHGPATLDPPLAIADPDAYNPRRGAWGPKGQPPNPSPPPTTRSE